MWSLSYGQVKEEGCQGSWDGCLGSSAGFDSRTVPPAAASGFLPPLPEASMTISFPLIRAKLNPESISLHSLTCILDKVKLFQ